MLGRAKTAIVNEYNSYRCDFIVFQGIVIPIAEVLNRCLSITRNAPQAIRPLATGRVGKRLRNTLQYTILKVRNAVIPGHKVLEGSGGAEHNSLKLAFHAACCPRLSHFFRRKIWNTARFLSLGIAKLGSDHFRTGNCSVYKPAH